MPFEELAGSERIKTVLSRIIEKKRVGHAFLFAGPSGGNKREFARAFATEVICQEDPSGNHRRKIQSGNHPDLHFLSPEGKIGLHTIDALRALSREVHLPPNEGCKKAFIIEGADRMYPASANALLKTFEEPPLDTLIILVTDHPAALLPTIRSRCAQIDFPALNQTTEQPAYLDKVRLLLAAGAPLYSDIKRIAGEISKELEEARDELLKTERETHLDNARERLTAVQVAEIDKGIEGVGSAYLRQEMNRIVRTVLTWYRDIIFLKCKGSEQKLLTPPPHTDLQALKANKILPLETIQERAQHALTALDRSTPMHICIENLLLSTQG